jgi:hypothetical protein
MRNAPERVADSRGIQIAPGNRGVPRPQLLVRARELSCGFEHFGRSTYGAAAAQHRALAETGLSVRSHHDRGHYHAPVERPHMIPPGRGRLREWELLASLPRQGRRHAHRWRLYRRGYFSVESASSCRSSWSATRSSPPSRRSIAWVPAAPLPVSFGPGPGTRLKGVPRPS